MCDRKPLGLLTFFSHLFSQHEAHGCGGSTRVFAPSRRYPCWLQEAFLCWGMDGNGSFSWRVGCAGSDGGFGLLAAGAVQSIAATAPCTVVGEGSVF